MKRSDIILQPLRLALASLLYATAVPVLLLVRAIAAAIGDARDGR